MEPVWSLVAGAAIALASAVITQWTKVWTTRAELNQASRESASKWLRERHSHAFDHALQAASEVSDALIGAKGDISAAANAENGSQAKEKVASARRHREVLRRAHARLSMVAPAAGAVVTEMRALLEEFEVLIQEHPIGAENLTNSESWQEKDSIWRRKEQEFLAAMVDFLYDPRPKVPSGADLGSLRRAVRPEIHNAKRRN